MAFVLPRFVVDLVQWVRSVIIVSVLGLHRVILLLLVLLGVAGVVELISMEVGLLRLRVQLVTIVLIEVLATTFSEEDWVRDRSLSLPLKWRQIRLQLGGNFGDSSDGRHVRLRTVTRHFILDLEVVEALALVQCVHVLDSTSHVATIVGPRRAYLLLRATIAAIWLLVRVAVRIVNEALLLEEVFAASISNLIDFSTTVAPKGIILYIDLALATTGVVAVFVGLLLIVYVLASIFHNVLLEHADEADQLTPLHLLRVEVVSFSYVEMRDDLISGLVLEHV